MRHLIFALVLSVLSLPAFPLVVGTVDVNKVLFTVKEGKKILKELEQSFNKKKADLGKEESKLKKEKEKFDKKASLLSGKAKNKEQEKLQRMLLELETKRQKYQSEIREMEARLKEPVIKRIYGVVKEVAKDAKVDVAFDKGVTPLLYASREKDLTNDVIKRHNKKYPGKK